MGAFFQLAAVMISGPAGAGFGSGFGSGFGVGAGADAGAGVGFGAGAGAGVGVGAGAGAGAGFDVGSVARVGAGVGAGAGIGAGSGVGTGLGSGIGAGSEFGVDSLIVSGTTSGSTSGSGSDAGSLIGSGSASDTGACKAALISGKLACTTFGSLGGAADSRLFKTTGLGGGSMVINSISKGGVMGGGVSGFMVIFANPNPTNPCKAAATDKANTLIFLELSTEITTVNQSAQAERVTGKLYTI